ncbi:MAG: hypothetical protein PHT94_00890 [Candidatus Nanoarchaeia archaeon]|nr:hypothetical protein [Candidatus Nanoarchaeia archaeon]
MIECQTFSEICQRCTPTKRCGWDCWFCSDEIIKKINDQIEDLNGKSKMDH